YSALSSAIWTTISMSSPLQAVARTHRATLPFCAAHGADCRPGYTRSSYDLYRLRAWLDDSDNRESSGCHSMIVLLWGGWPWWGRRSKYALRFSSSVSHSVMEDGDFSLTYRAQRRSPSGICLYQFQLPSQRLRVWGLG